ncbi:hypothetical protein [Solitalea koreensis]|uniref:Uncharacterized protein n=1 Tax=Solitalea koreensis TaxID=543615 RepID=A0A521DJL2_9SPHI|nr:hypothetical protein [Solitalea koreensis]SMO71923.1 hypothetical protein SAMN06265350_10757 [Solitalea koreensis]
MRLNWHLADKPSENKLLWRKYSKNRLMHDSAQDIEVFPVSDKGKKLDRPGGYAQRLIVQ